MHGETVKSPSFCLVMFI